MAVLLGAILTAVLGGGWLVLYRLGNRQYGLLVKLPVKGLRMQQLTPPFLYLLEAGKASVRAAGLFFQIQRSVQKIHGLRRGHEITLLVIADSLVYGWLAMIAGGVWTLAGGGLTALAVGTVLGVLLPAAMLKDLSKKARIRDQDIIMALPELLNKIILLVSAGENVQRAIMHCADRRKQGEHPLYSELRLMTAEWEGGQSFQQAFEQFSKRCAIQEISIFTTTVLLNYRRGGGDFVLALRDLSRVLWEKRKAIARTRGEQASSKLVFPMVVIFLVVIVLVGGPAFMMMNM